MTGIAYRRWKWKPVPGAGARAPDSTLLQIVPHPLWPCLHTSVIGLLSYPFVSSVTTGELHRYKQPTTGWIRHNLGLAFYSCLASAPPSHPRRANEVQVLDHLLHSNITFAFASLSLLSVLVTICTCTMHVTVNVGDISLWALLDSGSTHNFIDTGAADRVGSCSTGASGCVWRWRTVIVSQAQDTALHSTST
jgi:hypothetical protein